MTIPCPQRITCPGNSPISGYDSPLANLSSELTDGPTFIAETWDWDINVPPLGSDFNTDSCLGVCESTISQADADLCAARLNLLCHDSGWQPPGGIFPPGGGSGSGTHYPIYANSPQSCSSPCPDGSVFTIDVPAGMFLSLNATMANRMAQSFACREAARTKICLGTIRTTICEALEYDSTLRTTGGTPPLQFTVVAGNLPPGIVLIPVAESPANNPSVPPSLSFSRSVRLFGTVTTPGTYNFSIRATDLTTTRYNTKSFTIQVMGITNINPMPTVTENTLYSQQITVSGSIGALTFIHVDGTLPTGLSISGTGLVSGTPAYATAGDYPFTVSVTDSTGLNCTKSGTIHVQLRPGPDWTKLVWTSYQLNSNPGKSTCSGGASGNTWNGQLDNNNTVAGVGDFARIGPAHAQGVFYTGGAVTARIRITASAGGSGFNTMLHAVLRAGVQIGGFNMINVGSGVFTADVAIPISAGQEFTMDWIGGGNWWAQVTGVGAANSLTFSGVIYNL